MSDTVRPRATEPFALLGRKSITLHLIIMQRLIDIGSTMHNLSVLLSAVEVGNRTQNTLALVQ